MYWPITPCGPEKVLMKPILIFCCADTGAENANAAVATAATMLTNRVYSLYLLLLSGQSSSYERFLVRCCAMKGSARTVARMVHAGSSENPPQRTCTLSPGWMPRSRRASEIIRRSVGL